MKQKLSAFLALVNSIQIEKKSTMETQLFYADSDLVWIQQPEA